MDPRRLLILCLAALSLGGCALLRPARPPAAGLPEVPTTLASATLASPAAPTAPQRVFASMAPIPNPEGRAGRSQVSRPAASAAEVVTRPSVVAGRDAIVAANLQARTPSSARAFQGGLQVFEYEPGRIYEVWAAPLRVTTLTLAPGEKVIAKAAGDTVRWQIGETVSGEGEAQRAHVMIKPLTLGLETNLALTTNRRLYLLQLRSGPPAAFNTSIAWDVGAALDAAGPEPVAAASAPTAAVGPPALLDARFAIRPKGKRPAWTPAAVMTDGVRTYLSLPAAAEASETPALFAVDPSGDAQMVNYRQHSGLWVVDRVLDRAELRLGGRRPQVVRIERLAGAS